MKTQEKIYEKGITLVALVITIIILLILAGVTINIVINGELIEKSQTAVDKYSEEQARENLQLALLEYKMKRLTGENVELNDFLETIEGITVDEENNKVNVGGYDFTVNEETLEIEGGNKGESSVTPEQKTKYTVTINKGTGIENVTQTQDVEEGQSLEIIAEVSSGYIFSKWNVTEGKESDVENLTSATTKVTPTENIIIEATAKTPQIANGNNLTGTEHGTITGGEYSYNNPVIPVGFRTSDEGASWTSTNGIIVDGWNEGLVIQDEDGNQFVWVPVDGTNVTFARWTSTKNGNPTADNTSDDTNVMPVTTAEETFMVSTYGGFYIGRYEAGIPSTLPTAISTLSKNARNVPGTPVIKQNQVPWSYIDYTTASANAKKVCELTNVKSGLVTGRMWDATMKWIENLCGTNDENNVQTDSRKWGNYFNAPVEIITEYSTTTSGTATWTTVTSQTKGTSTSWLLKTGHTEYTNRKNIYDLAGNLWEWTAEVYDSTDRVFRGGDYLNSGTSYPAAYRINYSTSGAYVSFGFRVVLFIQ